MDSLLRPLTFITGAIVGLGVLLLLLRGGVGIVLTSCVDDVRLSSTGLDFF